MKHETSNNCIVLGFPDMLVLCTLEVKMGVPDMLDLRA